jgi:hypothetical protein
VCPIQQLFVRTHRHLANSAVDGFSRFLHALIVQLSFLVLLFRLLSVCDVDLLYLNVLAVTSESQYLASFDYRITHSCASNGMTLETLLPM